MLTFIRRSVTRKGNINFACFFLKSACPEVRSMDIVIVFPGTGSTAGDGTVPVALYATLALYNAIAASIAVASAIVVGVQLVVLLAPVVPRPTLKFNKRSFLPKDGPTLWWIIPHLHPVITHTPLLLLLLLLLSPFSFLLSSFHFYFYFYFHFHFDNSGVFDRYNPKAHQEHASL